MRRRRNPLHALATQIAALRKSAEALGLFSDDRELLECSGCGLMENVLAGGTLITCRAPKLGRDTGQRFRKLGGNRFRCPECGSILRAE